MFIQTEETPNPATLKFLPGSEVLTTGTADFPNRESADTSALASRLFTVPEVTAVFLGSDFVTVTKAPEADWQVLKPAVLGVIMEHYTAGDPVMHEAAGPAHAAGDGENQEVVHKLSLLGSLCP